MGHLIRAQGLHKTYSKGAKPLEVLRGVDLTMEPGEAIAIVGSSGAGKSTLLHLLGSLDQPTEGKVFFEGQDLDELSDKALSRFRCHKMGFVFQFHHLLPMLTAEENVSLPALIGGVSQEKAKQLAHDLLNRVGLDQRLTHRPSELSGGEQQRVAIARALVMKPKVLFADEPTGNLDSRAGEQVASLLLEICHQYQMGLVVVTHNQKIASQLSHQLHLVDGKILTKDT